MKNKTILLLLLIMFAVSIMIGNIVFAKESNSTDNKKILTGEKIDSVGESYKEIDKNLLPKDLINSSTELATKFIKKYNLVKDDKKLSNLKVTRFNNFLESRTETVIYNDQFTIKVNENTGEFLSYINNKTSFEINKMEEKEVEEVAIKIFNNLDISNLNDYKIQYIEKFDDEIWRVGFVKKYGDLINEGESIKFSFIPGTSEIVTLSVNNLKYANNEILISEIEAREIVKEYLDKSSGEEMGINIEIVRPNYFLEPVSTDGRIYKNINEARKAYVFKLNNEAKTEIYVDCTTGQIIGGDMLEGGVF